MVKSQHARSIGQAQKCRPNLPSGYKMPSIHAPNCQRSFRTFLAQGKPEVATDLPFQCPTSEEFGPPKTGSNMLWPTRRKAIASRAYCYQLLTVANREFYTFFCEPSTPDMRPSSAQRQAATKERPPGQPVTCLPASFQLSSVALATKYTHRPRQLNSQKPAHHELRHFPVPRHATTDKGSAARPCDAKAAGDRIRVTLMGSVQKSAVPNSAAVTRLGQVDGPRRVAEP